MKRCSILFALLVAMSCHGVGGEPQASRTVLLVSESTRFKNSLIESMQTLLEDKGITVTVEANSRRNLGDYEAVAFDAVFITNSGVNSRVRPWVVRWLADNQAQRSRILLHTTQTRDWTVDVNVDAVTSASAMGEVEALATRYVERLLALITAADGDGATDG